MVGRFDLDESGLGFVQPFDRRILTDVHIPTGPSAEAEPGEMVLVEITTWPTPARGPVGSVIEVLGNINEKGVDTEIIIRKFGIPDAHGDAAIEEAKAFGAVSAKDIAGRTDFRQTVTVTIDGEHARDFDDAISIERLPNGNYYLGVHIADVAHYVDRGERARSGRLRARRHRSTFRIAPCTCSRRSWRPASAVSTRRSIASCSRV